jgi:hypothetical protein
MAITADGKAIGPATGTGYPGYPPQLMTIAGTGITATTAATAVALTNGTVLRDATVFLLLNSCNQTIKITLGTTSSNGVDFLQLESGDEVLLDLASDGFRLPSGIIVGAYNTGTAPTSGTVRVTLL